MYEKIKQLADEAVALQNKNRMDAVLRAISGLCEACAVVEPKKAYAPGLAALTGTSGGVGMARLKMEGRALHPDDIDADMTPAQEARQRAAYERAVAETAAASTNPSPAMLVAASKLKEAIAPAAKKGAKK